MNTLHTICTATHVAVIDAFNGYGAIVCPSPATDIENPIKGDSLHASDWNAIVRGAGQSGYWPAVDDDGDMMREPGEDTGGLEVVVLEGDAIASEFDPVRFMAARAGVLGTALARSRTIGA